MSIHVTMGAVGSIPAVVGNLANRMLYYLMGANYNQQSISRSAVSGNEFLVRWRGQDFHVYDRMGYVIRNTSTYLSASSLTVLH